MVSVTDKYYAENAAEYAASTVDVDISHLYSSLLEQLKPGGKILDAGCGSGRDSLVFINRGFKVTAFDACSELAEKAEELTGLKVRVQRFQDMAYEAEFDGIWACATLLHVPQNELPGVLTRCRQALKPGGTMFCSFKHGEQASSDERGREFTNMTVERLEQTLTEADFGVLRCWMDEVTFNGKKTVWIYGVARNEDD